MGSCRCDGLILGVLSVGFVILDTTGREVYVHSSVLFRSDMTDPASEQRVFVRSERVPRGHQATEIEEIP